ncbi:uncharacterized protein FFB20_13060 [Fusarium fujikuroi]|uniref:Uncharacterized protein n=1 Tax=Fusarium fujikuroi TaxID=5127 RepID=A0A2H3RXD3_FUSFU|nr:Uncharacterized protein Y057_6962 [Fusarium fujikuroi]SCN74628.1 uncharacterized protein FFC1_02127 [Fusarium fujikuroi]SCO08548.1 uncharacterized protein FFB20_13060 [Fusarium fujikuroi]SCO08897.1 uncharacterized protein FFE2_11699 [Fusarium fujikuroi]SCO47467.1 uncharacterized protein FFNC_11533 [Fusarium fujikuroi]
MARKNNRKSRRRTKSKATERILWSTTDRLQLLAYLDWCVQYCVKFEVTAPGYLERLTGKQFSKERIRQKLYKEWQNYGLCGKFNDLFELGTAGLTPLVGEEQETFHRMFTSISPAQEARCTRSRSLGLAAKSGTLSAPRSIYSISSSREPNELSIPQAGKPSVVPERPGQKTRAKSSLAQTRQPSSNDLSEDELAREDSNMERVKSEDDPKLSTIASPELSDVELQPAPVIPDSQEDAMTVVSQAAPNFSMEVRLKESEANLLKQKSYSVTLENRISELKRRNHDLEDCIRLASSAQGEYGEETRLREVISSLKDKLDRKRLLEKNQDDLDADRLGFLNTSLRAEYQNLHSNVRDTSSMICHLSLNDALAEQRTNFSHLANSWARRIGGNAYDLGSLLSHCETAQIPKKVVLASLLTAGIFELVLEDVFPAFLAANSPLLDQYRKHIETQNGWHALQRLDVISIKSLVSDKDIKNRIISEQAEWLSSLMLESLSYFLPLESRDIPQRLPRNEPETETVSDMRSTLHHALKVKIELMLSIKRLKYLFVRPGTLFDAEKMKVGQSQAGDTARLGQKVKICLLPALFTVSEAGNETRVEEASFSASYSKAVAEVKEEDMESLVLVEKAIVFL